MNTNKKNNTNNSSNNCKNDTKSISDDKNNDNDNGNEGGFWDKVISKYGEHSIYGDDNYNRWKIVPMAVSTHLCLGACYAWSLFNEPLTRELGVVGAVSNDWMLSQVILTFTGIIVCQGTTMFLCGKWIERVGARICGVTGSIFYGGGMCVGSLGVYLHTLPIIYIGYGLLAGAGMGLAYLPPIATLIKWFPDKRGLATGMAVCGFGGGAILITSLKKNLLEYFFQSPQYIGTMQDINSGINNNNNIIVRRSEDTGQLLAQIGNNVGGVDGVEWKEVLNVNSNELSNIGLDNLNEGLYLVGTGNTGVAATMGTLGVGYLVVCLTSALMIRVPKPGYKPVSMIEAMENKETSNNSSDSSDKELKEEKEIIVKYVNIDDIMKTPQFWLLWTTFLATCTAGMGLVSCAKDVLQTCFATSPAAMAMGPTVFAATYVQALSLANLGGRFIWASASDKLGRKRTFGLFSIGVPLYLTLPWIVSSGVGAEMSNTPLILFYGSSLLIFSFFGGGYSTVPAYESDLFGSKYIAATHGRTMTASALSGVLGPGIFSMFYSMETKKAIKNLTDIIDNKQFIDSFGVSKDNIDMLISNKTVNIAKLLELCPDGTTDPTPYLYDPAFKTMGVVMGIGALANLALKPVDHKWFKQDVIKYRG